ncbi:MAG: RNA methyltransferase [Solirubrobacterales bacterium]
MITSPHNEKLKLIRRLARKGRREREDLFVAEGEDLTGAARRAGADPEVLLCAAGSGLEGEETDPSLLAEASGLGSGTRSIGVYHRAWAEPGTGPCVYLHGVSDPGNVGAVIRTGHALLGATVVLGPGCADPYSAKAVRASMGSVFARPPARGALSETPGPRAALVARGGEGLERLAGAVTLCLGAEREGLPAEVLERCEAAVTIPLRAGAESLNVAAAAAIACERISSPPHPSEER